MRIFGTGPDRLVDLADVNPAALANGYAPVWNLATSKFTMQPVVTGGGVSLSDITAGTLQVPLNMVGSSSLTSTNVQIIGNNTNDLLLHVPDTGSIGFAEAGNVRLRYQYYASPGAGFAPASYLYNNTSGAGNNTDKLILAGGTPDPSIGTSVGTFSYVAVYGYDAEFTYGAYGSVHYGTATVGASVANAKHYFHGYNDTGGFPSATIAPAGIEIYKLNQAYAVLLRANNITAGRTFDFPDASGTLMVSGGSGSVPLDNLTAGTLGVSLQMGSASDSPAGSVAYLRYDGTSTILNVPTGKTILFDINASEQARITTAGIDLSTNSKAIVFGTGGSAGSADRRMAGTSLGVDINAPTGAARIRLLANGNVQFATDVDIFWLGNGAYAGDTTKSYISGGGTGSLILNSPTGATYTRFLTGGTFSGYVGNGLGGFGKPASGDATQAGISWQSGGVVISTGNGAGNRVQLQAAGTTQFAFQTDFFWLGPGAYAGDTTKSYVTGGGVGNLTCNAGTASSVLLQVAGTTKYTFAAASLTFADAVDLALGTTTGTKFGTGTTQKLAFYNSTPVVQPSGNIKTALTNLGLVANPSQGWQVVTKTTTYTATATDDAIVCTSGTFTVTLPAATGSGKILVVKNAGAGTITADGNASETIDGNLTQSVAAGASLMIIDYASGLWAII